MSMHRVIAVSILPAVALAILPGMALAESPSAAWPTQPLVTVAPLPPQPVRPALLGPDPQARLAWLSECRQRQLAQFRDWDRDGYDRRRRRDTRLVETLAAGPDYCEAYLDDYYAHAMAPPPAMAAGCCRPAAVAPTRECHETVEVQYIDVPPRARRVIPPRRAVPDKRIRVAPDKRIRTY